MLGNPGILALSAASKVGLLPPPPVPPCWVFGISKEVVSSLEQGFPRSILGCLQDPRKTPNSSLWTGSYVRNVFVQGSRHVPAPAHPLPTRGGGSRAWQMWHGSEMAARWQEPNPGTCPGLCPRSALAGRRTEQGAVLEVRASSAAAVISAGRGISTNEPLCSQQGAGNISHRISRWLMQQCLPSMSQGEQGAPGLVPAPQTSSSTGAGSSTYFPSLVLQPFPSAQPGLEIPIRMPGWDHSLGSHGLGSLHTARLSQGHGICCLGYPKTTTCTHSLDWDAAPSVRWRGTRQLLWHCSLHTHPGASQSRPSPGWGLGAASAPQKTRGGLREVGGFSHSTATSCTHGAAENRATMGALSGLGGTEQGPSAGTVTPQEFCGVRGKIFLLGRVSAGIVGTGNRCLSGAPSAPSSDGVPRVKGLVPRHPCAILPWSGQVPDLLPHHGDTKLCRVGPFQWHGAGGTARLGQAGTAQGGHNPSPAVSLGTVLHIHPSQRPLFCFSWFKQDKKTEKPQLPTPPRGTFAWRSAVCGSNPTKQSGLATAPKQPLPHSPATLPTPWMAPRSPKPPECWECWSPSLPRQTSSHNSCSDTAKWWSLDGASPKKRCEKAGKDPGGSFLLP